MGTGEQYLRGGHIVRYPGHVNALLVMRVLLVLALCLCSQAGIAQMFEDPTVGLSVTTDSVTENAPSGIEVSVRASRAGAGSSREEDLSTSVALAQSTVSGICGRTPQVRDGLLAVVQAKDATAADCSQVTTAHLQALTGTMDLSNRGITSLRSGDMTGLTNLATMFLSGNALTGLPDGIFASLTSLEELYLYGNDLRMLPDGIFDGFASLRNLNLNDNDLRTLPDGIFQDLANLRSLHLDNNPGSDSFRPGADAGTDRNAVSGTTVGLDGSASGGGPWGTNITHAWSVADGLGNPVTDLTLTGEDTSTPSFITPETVPGGELVFTLTVQGKGRGRIRYTSIASVRVAIRAVPAVTSVALVSVPTIGTTYGNDERIEVAVTFEESATVDVSDGTPSIVLTVGTAAKTAGYLRGSGSWNLVFAYEVRASDTDTDGVSVPANSLARNGGRIVNPDGLEFRLTHDGLSDDIGHKVNGIGVPLTGGVCGRTPEVRAALLAAVQANDATAANCSQVTTAHLQALTGALNLVREGIVELKSGDFANLTSLGTLYLNDNDLRTLPDGIFEGLASLSALNMSGNDLRTLPDGVFKGLANLGSVFMAINALTELPDGVFEGLDNLFELNLGQNDLRTLPAGVFEGLANLSDLYIHENDLRTLPDGVFEGLANLSALFLGDNPGTASFRPTADAGADRKAVSGRTVRLDGSASGGGPWGTNITYAWVVADGLGNPVSDLTLTGEDTSTPSFIMPETVPGGELVFTLTVQGAGNVLYKSTASVRVAIRAAPVVTSVALVSVPTNGTTYNNGERIEVAVTFEEPARVIVSGGTPSIGLTVGTAAKTAGYLRGSGGVNLVFAYEVQASDTDTDGVSVPANSLARNGGRIVNPDGLEFRLTHDGLSDDTGHKVNGTGSPPTGGVCGRTPEVRAALLTRVQANHANVADCSQVTTARLQALTGTLHLGREGIVDLQSGDFADLTSLRTLDLLGNDLETLPEGLFQGLASLETLALERNALTELPDGLFEGLASLNILYLFDNELGTLPEGLFEGLANLSILSLNDNNLRTLPDGIFEDLASLRSMSLDNNPGTASFRTTADAGADQKAVSGSTVRLDGSASRGGPWGTNITYAWSVADGLDNPVPDLRLKGGDTSRPSFITPETVPASGLVFTLTVRGKGHGEGDLDESTASMRVALDVLPLVWVNRVDRTVTEGTNAQFRFSRSRDSTSRVEVQVKISGHRKVMSSAVRDLANNTDSANSTVVTFEAGTTETTLDLATEADMVNEGDGEVSVAIMGPSEAYEIGPTGAATVLVRDDDIPQVTLRWVSPAMTLQNNVWVGSMTEGQDIEYVLDCTGGTLAPESSGATQRIPVRRQELLNHPTHGYNHDFSNRFPCAESSPEYLGSERQRYVGPDNGRIEVDLFPQVLSLNDVPGGNSYFNSTCYLDGRVGPPPDIRFCPKYTLGAVTSARIDVTNRNPTLVVEALDDEVPVGESARFRVNRIWEADVLAAYSTAFSFTITASGPFAESVPDGSRTFVAGGTELIFEVPTMDDGVPGDNGLVTFELEEGLPEVQASNIAGSYEVYDQLPGITPRGKNSRMASVQILRNAAPTSSDRTVTTDEDTAYTFGAGNFAFADTDSGDGLVSVKVVTLPAAGTLALDGAAVSAGQVVAASDLGRLGFTPAADANGTGYAGFAFRVSDGVSESAAAYTMTVDVTAVNDPATGLPTIAGTARVGRELTADAGGIADDADGLPAPSTFSYQWLRVAGGSETEIPGATATTYRVVAADVGAKFKVRVSFTDLDGHAETLTSAAYPADSLVSDARGVTVSETGLDIAEGGGGTYTVVLDSQPTGQVTVTPARTSGDADVTVSGALTFTADDWAAPRTVTVGAAHDLDADDDAAVIGHTVSGADYGSVTAASVDVTVDDDETASSGVALSVSPDEVGEGAGATTVTVTARLNGGARGEATPVAVTVGSGTATPGTDFAAVPGFTISIPANTQSHTGTFVLSPTRDTVDEPDETVRVNGTTTVAGLSVTGATLEIADDDASPTATLSLSDSSIGEDGGSTSVTASLSHASSVATAIAVSASPVSPAEASDYILGANMELTVAAGATASTGLVTIGGVDNDIDAADKTVRVKGAAVNTLGVSGPSDVELTLEDDDARGVTVSETGLDIAEGGGGTYTVVLDSQPTGQVTVTPARTSGDADVTVSGALTFTADDWAAPRTVTVGAAHDLDADDDAAVIGHTVSGADYGAVTVDSVDVTVDDDETASSGVALTVSPESVGEGVVATTVTVTARLNGGARSEATPVAVAVGSGTAISGTDFAEEPGFTITIAANRLSNTGTFMLSPTRDRVDEPDETVRVDGATTVAGLSVTGTTLEIIDDDASPTATLSLSDTSIAEDGGVATVTAGLSHASSEPTTVTVSVSPDSPATNSDYVLSADRVLTVAAGATASTGSVTVTGVNNDVDTLHKTVRVKGLAANNLGVTGPPDVELSILDDDGVQQAIGPGTSSGAVELSVSPHRVGEGAGATTVTVRAALDGLPRSAATPVAVTVGSGTATPGTDFAAVPGFTITVAANTLSNTGTFVLSPTRDTVDEPDETVVVDGATTAPGLAVTGTEVEITDDDFSPTVTLSLSDTSISEAGGVATVTAGLSHASSEPTTVTVSVSPDSPAVSGDYSLGADRVLTVAAGATASTGSVTVTGVDNDVDAADKTVAVTGAASNALGISGPVGVELTLEDDDARGVTVSETGLDIAEGGGGTYTVVLDSQPTGQVTVTPARTSGDADVTVSGALTFTADDWAAPRTVTVGAAHDLDADDDAAVIGHTVSGADYGSVTAASVDVTVDDDETASSGVALSVSPDEVGEGAGATTVTVTARLNGGARGEATPVAVTVGSGTATPGTDFAAVPGFTITIAANTLSNTGTFVLSPTRDTVDEPDETVAVDGATTAPGLAVTGTTLEIADDDASPTATLSLSDSSIGEDGGSTSVTASLSHASSVATAIAVSASPVSPAEASDYILGADRVLTVAAGATASTGSVTVTGVDNDVDAADKTVAVTGAASNALGISGPVGVELTLEDDDARGVTVSETGLDIAEGGGGTYTVVLDSQPTGQVTVTPARTSGDADVTVSGALTFTADDWAAPRTVTVGAAHDLDADDDAAVIGHTVSGADYGSVTAASVDVTVDDDETASSGVALSVSPDEVGEGAGATTVTVTARLNGGARGEATPVAVTVGSGTATPGTDFAAVPGFTISIPANTQSHTGTFVLSPTRDTVDEPDETVRVNGTTTVAGLSVTGATLEIADDDASPTATLSLSDSSIGEDGGSTSVTASLSHASSVATAIAVSASPVSPAEASDYILGANMELTVAAGATASTGLVTIGGVDNDIDAADKTVRVKGAAVNTLGVSGPSDVELTLEDDDARGVTVSETGLDIAEGGGGTYTVVLDSQPTGQVTVTPARTSGDADVTVSGALTFTADDWAAPRTVTVGAAHDLDADDDAAVIGHTVSGADYGAVTVDSVDVTVDDDETASSGVALTVSPESVGEGVVATTVTVTARLNGGARSEATPVAVAVGSGTAISGTDFAEEPGFTITIAANRLSNTGTFMLSPTRDRVDEPDETVRVDGATTVAGLSVTGTTLEIIDDDASPTATLSLSDTSIAEDGGVATVTAGLSHASSEPTTVTVSVSPDSPATNSDYVLSADRVLTVAAGATASTGSVTVTGVNNDVDTLHKTVRVKGLAANNLGVTGPPDVELSILDDDGVQQAIGPGTSSGAVELSVSPHRVGEGAGATTVTVRAALDGLPRSAATPVAVTVGSGTATPGTDFAAVPGFTITVAANTLSNTGTFVLSPTRDTVDEPDETVVVDGATTAPGLAVTGTEVEITDDDFSPTVTLSLSDTSISEAGGVATVTAGLSHASSEPTTVTVSVSPDSPAVSGDYSLGADRVLTVAAGATASTGSVTVTGVDNDVDAADKTVAVTGAASNALGISGPVGVELTLEDDDARGVTVSETGLDIAEGGGGTYTVVLDSQPTGQVTVTPARTSGDADVTVSGALTFTADDWAAPRTVTVGAAHDLDADDDAAVIGHTVSGADYGSVTAASVDVTVDDDETASSGVALSVSPDEVGEGAGATTVTVTARLNGGARGEATPVAVTVGSGTATPGTDFAAVPGFTITIAANTLSNTGTFVLSPTRDTVDEPDETVAVDGATTAPGLAVTGTTLEIADDDASPTATLSLSDSSIGEDGGSTSVTASLSHASSVATAIAVSASPVSPAEASDYILGADRVLTVAAGATASTGSVTVTGVDNDVDAADKTVAVTGAASNALGISGPVGVELTLEDDDARGVTVSETGLDIAEGGGGTYTVVLDSQPTGQVTVTPARTSGDADVTVSGALTFTADDWAAPRTVTVGAAHDLDADDDAAVIGHTVSGADYGSVTAASVDVTVDDDETASSGVALSVSPDEVGEGAGATTVTVTARLNGGARGEATPVAVTVGSGTATPGTDFAAVPGFTISIPANTQSHTGTFVLSPTRDTVDEPDETVRVNGTTTVAGLSVTGATLEIADDDASPTATLSLSDSSIGEDGGSTSVTASLSHASSVATAIAVSASPVSPAEASDYILGANMELTVAAGATASTGLVTIGGVDNDIDAADKTVRVKGAAVNTLGVSGPSDVELTLEDDDARGVTVSETGLDIAEGGGGTYTVVLDSQPTGQVTVTPARTSGDADVTVSGALTFTADDWAAPRTVTVGAAHDLDADDDAAVIGHTVSGADYGAVTVDSVDVTVDDDETASSGVALTVSPESVGEGVVATTVTVTARLNGGARSEATPVAVAVGSGTAISGTDFAEEPGFTITIAANRLSNTGTFMLSPTRDRVDEPDETVRVDGATTVAGLSVTGTTLEIIDDDASPTATLSLSDTSIAEDGGVATVTAGLSHASSEPTTVTVSVSPDSPATNSDYVLSADRVLTVAAGATASTGSVTVTGVNNDVDTLHKTVRVKGLAANNLGVTGPPDVELSILDDDGVQQAIGPGTSSGAVELSVSPHRVGEGAGATTVTVRAALDGLPRSAATPVAVTVGSGTATPGTDFAAVPGFTITVAANTLSNTGTFVLSPTRDTVDEPDETVVVDGATTAPGLAVTGTEVEITDDDFSPTVTLSLSDTSISEAGGVATVTAGLSHASSEPTTVTVSVSPDSPAVSGDYSLGADRVLTVAAGATASTGSVTVTGVDNDVDAADKTVAVTGAASNALGISGPVGVELTLEDDDARGVTVSETGLDIAEGGGGTYTVVLDSQPTGQVTVTPARTSGDADVTVSGALTFTADDWAAPRTVTVGAAHDLDADDDAAVIGHTVSGADYGSVTAASVDVTVDDDETASSGVALSVSPDEVGEGAGATTVTVTARLNGGARGEATPVAVTVGSGTATPGTDFAAVPGFTITIAANTLSNTGTFVLSPTRDTVDEPDETVAVDGATTAPGLAVTGTTLEIADDDASPTATLSLSDSSIGEDGGSTSVTASLSHASSVATAIAVSASPVSPAEASDYILGADRVLTVAAGATASTGSVTVTGVDNDVDAADKTVAVTGAASNALGISGPVGVELTLEDDDARGVTVSETGLDIAEGGGGTYTVVLDSQPTGQVTVTPARTSGDADVTVSGALTFTADDWAAPRTVTVGAAHDLDADDDAAVIGHTVSGADYGSVTAASVDVTVDDDETASSGVALSVSPDEVGEGAGATTVTVTARLNGGARGEATPVAVTVGSGTATPGTDFAAVPGFTISIPANTQSHTGTFVLSPTRDTVDEPDETVSGQRRDDGAGPRGDGHDAGDRRRRRFADGDPVLVRLLDWGGWRQHLGDGFVEPRIKRRDGDSRVREPGLPRGSLGLHPGREHGTDGRGGGDGEHGLGDGHRRRQRRGRRGQDGGRDGRREQRAGDIGPRGGGADAGG